MKSLSPVLASLANAFKIPLRPLQSASRPCSEALKVSSQFAARPFSSTTAFAAKKGGRPKNDSRVSKCHLVFFPFRPLFFDLTVPSSFLFLFYVLWTRDYVYLYRLPKLNSFFYSTHPLLPLPPPNPPPPPLLSKPLPTSLDHPPSMATPQSQAKTGPRT